MRCVGIELNLLEMLEGETIQNKNFNLDEWSLEEIIVLRRIANFVEREKDDREQSKQFVKDLQPKTH